MKITRLLFLITLLSSITASAQQLAFPGAEGFGKYAVGGRGGEVYKVTNLNDAGAGSFREAVSQPNRTVVFEVGGVIRIKSRIVVQENITIAGQTAPGEGITVYGNGLSFSDANNTITRYIRVRMGKVGDKGKDAVAIARGHDMIFDHVSITWGRDGTFDLNGEVENVTLQHSIIGQGLQTHSTGGLIQPSGGVSILGCLWINNHTRNPKVKGINQYINNVVYNWAVAGYIQGGGSQGKSYANVEGNCFIAGPETRDTAPFNRSNENFHIYARDNWYDGNFNGNLDGELLPKKVYEPVSWMEEPFDYPKVNTLSPEKAYQRVVDRVGASLHRDEVDKFLIKDLLSLGKSGKTIHDEMELPMKGPGRVEGGKAQKDTDGDGMPDRYERKNGLDPRNAADGNRIDKDGYTELENYLNALVIDN
ncbi:pectate lyase [Echinicola sediminis]